ncbi:prophage MuSo2, tail fiber protein, putative [Vibrio ichthyoenteri ATCC 700023]|uniref:Prophage MuSo2, tail fiber protein, putative n=1 Tax=Vibrio ichthyoenteri ATCC 700023 TaxID=870968 RepID=F9S695_9VIBR|nr:hypothetical protein [Vibrio ichthyoenteri]EGU33933.1 prophage MuSo2, tail fiber protein, putative [Vibrio ichthyoenteri ATCC 700023]
MHPLQNGSQTTEKPPANNPIGDAGYFTESGNDARPSYPGADYFNAQIDEFKSLLLAAEIKFDPQKFNHLSQAVVAIINANKSSQWQPWNKDTTYHTGDICTCIIDGEVRPMQMYAGPNMSCVGKNPTDPTNRHIEWQSINSPFWWIDYKADITGMPFLWLHTTAPEWAVMEINVDLPVAVYWRLARRYPHLVSDGTINTGEIRGEFLRVLDQGRGADPGRVINSWQKSTAFMGDGDGQNMAIPNLNDSAHLRVLGFEFDAPGDPREVITIKFGTQTGAVNTEGMAGPGQGNISSDFARGRVRNIARPMAISI